MQNLNVFQHPVRSLFRLLSIITRRHENMKPWITYHRNPCFTSFLKLYGEHSMKIYRSRVVGKIWTSGRYYVRGRYYRTEGYWYQIICFWRSIRQILTFLMKSINIHLHYIIPIFVRYVLLKSLGKLSCSHYWSVRLKNLKQTFNVIRFKPGLAILYIRPFILYNGTK